MQIIIGDGGSGFAALGAVQAAFLLHPTAIPYLSAPLTPAVRDFMNAYSDVLPLKTTEMVNTQAVTELIIVDMQKTADLGRLSALTEQEGTRVIVYDSRPGENSFVGGTEPLSKGEGTTISSLVAVLKEKTIVPNSKQATLMGLGIYAATACLTLPSTAPEDFAALEFLSQAGCDFAVINQQMYSPLSHDQRNLLKEMLTGSELLLQHGVSILLTTCSFSRYVEGLPLLVKRLSTIENVDLVLCLLEMDGAVRLYAESRSNGLSVQDLLKPLGTSGTPRAAQAFFKGRSLADLREQVLKYLEECMPPLLTAGQIMSKVIRSLKPDEKLSVAAKAMLKYGHHAIPVLEKGHLLGIMSRRDVDRAINHGLAEARVEEVMSRSWLSVTPSATLDEVQRFLLKQEAGLLPVLDAAGEVAGVITRSDLLGALHSYSYPHWYQWRSEPRETVPQKTSLLAEMNDRLSSSLQGLLLLIGQEAARAGVRAYLVGGPVRDLLLSRPNQDVDVVVEPNALQLAENLGRIFGTAVKTYPQFQTATIKRNDGITVDLITARAEFYSHPAALPEVWESTLKQDLFRRDFTINTMAIALHGSDYGRFYDFYEGREDLEQGLIRTLYNLSFVDDPTRVLRAIRFEQRYGFCIENDTLRFLENAVRHDLLKQVSAERLKKELKAILSEERAPQMVVRMDELGVLPYLLPGLTLTDALLQKLWGAAGHIGWFEKLANGGRAPEHWLVYLLLLATGAPEDAALEWPEHLALTKQERALLTAFLPAAMEKPWLEQEETEEFLQLWLGQSLTAQVALAVLYGESMNRYFAEHSLDVDSLAIETDGRDLLNLGFTPGPGVGKVLRTLQVARIRGEITNKEEELALAGRLLLIPEEGR